MLKNYYMYRYVNKYFNVVNVSDLFQNAHLSAKHMSTVYALTSKPESKCSPAHDVKKPKKAEVNYCPTYPAGETAETLEKIRVAMLSEVNKRHNVQKLAAMMDKTFALRRQEVVAEAPMIAEFKTRWPALFNVHEVSEWLHWMCHNTC